MHRLTRRRRSPHWTDKGVLTWQQLTLWSAPPVRGQVCAGRGQSRRPCSAWRSCFPVLVGSKVLPAPIQSHLRGHKRPPAGWSLAIGPEQLKTANKGGNNKTVICLHLQHDQVTRRAKCECGRAGRSKVLSLETKIGRGESPTVYKYKPASHYNAVSSPVLKLAKRKRG
jgi:hypothetical protein